MSIGAWPGAACSRALSSARLASDASRNWPSLAKPAAQLQLFPSKSRLHGAQGGNDKARAQSSSAFQFAN